MTSILRAIPCYTLDPSLADYCYILRDSLWGVVLISFITLLRRLYERFLALNSFLRFHSKSLFRPKIRFLIIFIFFVSGTGADFSTEV